MVFNPNARVFSRVEKITGMKVSDTDRTETMSRILHRLFDEFDATIETDYLTEVYNRRAFDNECKRLIRMQQRKPDAMNTVVFFDINHFKNFNDMYGLGAGDAALKHVAKTLKETLRDTDLVARIGGDEFAVIMYDTGEHEAKELSRKVAEIIKRTDCNYRPDVTLMTSVAYGAHTITKDDVIDIGKNSIIDTGSRNMLLHKQQERRGDRPGNGNRPL